MPLYVYLTLSVYFISPLLILPMFLSNPIISSRNPIIIYTIQVGCALAFQIHYFELPCITVQFLGRIVYFAFILKASLYYSFLTTNPFILHRISRLFFTRRNKLRTQMVFIIGIPFVAINLTIPISFFIINGKIDSTCAAYPSVIVAVSFYLIFFLMIVFLIYMWLHGYEVFRMRLEFTLFIICSILTSILYNVLKPILILNEYYHMTAQFVVFTFYASYFPLLLVLFTREQKILIFEESYDLEVLLDAGQKHYCVENIFFLKEYQDYLRNNKPLGSASHIIANFIEEHSTHELNLSEELRISATFNFDENIELVNEHILDLVRSNILTHISS